MTSDATVWMDGRLYELDIKLAALPLEEADELELLMAESPAGENHGRKVLPLTGADPRDDEDDRAPDHDAPRDKRPWRTLNLEDHGATETRGVHGVIDGEESYHGMVAHRGVLTDDEFATIDWGRARALAAYALGASLQDLEVAYPPGAAGRPSERRQALMNRFDSRMLDIHEQGGNLTMLALALGWNIRPNGECRMMTKALARARAQRQERDA